MRVLDAINDIIDSNAGLRLRKNHSGGRVTPLSSPVSPTSDHPSVRSPKALGHSGRIVSVNEKLKTAVVRLDAKSGYNHKTDSKHYKSQFLRVQNQHGGPGARLSHCEDCDEDDALDLHMVFDDDQTYRMAAEGALTHVKFVTKPASNGGGVVPVSAKFADTAMDEVTSKYLKLQKRDGSTVRVPFKPKYANAVGNLAKGDLDPFRQIIKAGPSNLMKVVGPKLPSEKSVQVDTFRKIHRTGRQRASF